MVTFEANFKNLTFQIKTAVSIFMHLSENFRLILFQHLVTLQRRMLDGHTEILLNGPRRIDSQKYHFGIPDLIENSGQRRQLKSMNIFVFLTSFYMGLILKGRTINRHCLEMEYIECISFIEIYT